MLFVYVVPVSFYYKYAFPGKQQQSQKMAEGTFNRVRTFSSSNHHASTEIHGYIASQQNPRVREVNLAREVTKSSMIIPTFSKFKSHNRHLARYTLGLTADANSLAVLEQDNIINWCPHARTLIPLNTDSDGNCLLHAVSMYIWGVHDRRLTLRNFLHQKLQMALKSGMFVVSLKTLHLIQQREYFNPFHFILNLFIQGYNSE